MTDSHATASPLARRLAAALVLASAGGALAAGLAAPAHAQEANASLRGTITSGSAIQQVTAVQVDTGVRRTVQVAPNGNYNFASLRPGTYRLEIATADGLRTTDEFTLAVGQNALLDFDLAEFAAQQPGAPEAGEEPPVGGIVVIGNRIRSLEGGEVGDVISQREIDVLPQNNRNFLAFAETAPGVQFVTDGSGNSRLQGGAQNSRTVNVFIDGISQKDYILKNGITGQDSSKGNPFPQLAIGEYRVLSSNYKAEFDQVSSVAITAITQSGTNEFHGEGFFDFTNQDLRAKTPSEIDQDIDKVETQDMQFGGALGGPIIEDRLFFFVTYEGKRQQEPVEITPGAGFDVSFFPAQYANEFGALNRTFNENLYFGKLDFIPSERDLFQVTVKYRDETGVNLNSGQNAESTATDIDTEELRGLFRYERTEDNWINDFKVSYEDAKWAPTPRLFAPGFIFEDIDRVRLLAVGGSAGYQDKSQKGWAVQDDFTWIGFDSHTIKAGVKAKWVKLRTLQQNFFNPQYSYNAEFGGGFNDAIPYRVQFGALTGTGSPIVKSDNFQLGLYVQDDWEVTDRLTLNIGIRWDYEETPSYLDFVHPDDAVLAVSPANYPNLNDADYDINDFISTGSERKAFTGAFQPRIGFSYRLDEEGNFTLFGGFGRSYDRNQFDFLQQEISNGSYAVRTFNFITGDPSRTCTPSSTCVPFDASYLTEAGLAQLLANTPFGTGGRELRFITNDLKMPYSDQYSLGLRGKFDLWEAEIGYRHIESKDGFAYLLGNRRADGSFFPANARPDSPFGSPPPGYGSIIIGVNGIETREDAAHIKLTKAYTPYSPWNFTATYTFTEAEENRAFGETFSLDYPSLDAYPFVRSAGVPRHRFVATGAWDILESLTLSGKFQVQSPKFVKGFVNQDTAPFERLVVGTFVNTDWTQQLDLALTKSFGLPFLYDTAQIWVRADVLNVFNTHNYVDFNTNPNDTTRVPNSPTIFGERTNFNIGGYPPRTFKFSVGFEF